MHLAIHRRRTLEVLLALSASLVAATSALTLSDSAVGRAALLLLVGSVLLILLALGLWRWRVRTLELTDTEFVWRIAPLRREQRMPLAQIRSWRLAEDHLILDRLDGGRELVDLSEVVEEDRERLARELAGLVPRA